MFLKSILRQTYQITWFMVILEVCKRMLKIIQKFGAVQHTLSSNVLHPVGVIAQLESGTQSNK
jgi:hypothetical protein